MSKKILIAKVTKVFGIKGEVKIVVYSNQPQNIENYPLFNDKGEEMKLKFSNKNKTIIGTSAGNPIMIAKIDGVNDRTAAEALSGMEIYVNREDLGDINDDEFYYVDLVGLDVIDENSQKIGKVLNVLEYGAGELLEIEFDIKNLPKNYQKVANFPFKNEIFPKVSIKEGFVQMVLPEIVDEKE